MSAIGLAPATAQLAQAVPDEIGTMQSRMTRLERAAVLAVVILAAALRLTHVADASFWVDEGASINLSSTFATVTQDTHPPLYYSLLHVWMSAFGTSELAVRMPSVIAGVAAVFLIVQVGRLLAGPVAGLWAGLLMAVSVFQIAFSQEARMYAMLASVSLLANYFFLRVLQDQRRRYLVLYVLSAVLLTYTHLFGWLIIAVQNTFVFFVYVVLNRPGSDRNKLLVRWLICQAVVGLAFLPWALEMLHDPHLDRLEWIPQPRSEMLLSTIKQFASGSVYLAVVLVVLAVVGTVTVRAGRLRSFGPERTVLLILWLVVPIALAYAASVLLHPVYETRYLIGASVALYLAAAVGLARIRNRLMLVGVGAILLLMSGNDLREYFQGSRVVSGVETENWRQAAADINTTAQAGGLIVFEGIPPDAAYVLYGTRADVDIEQLRDRPIADEVRQLRQWTLHRSDVWLVQSRSQDLADGLAGSLLMEFRLAQDDGLPGVHVREFRKTTP